MPAGTVERIGEVLEEVNGRLTLRGPRTLDFGDGLVIVVERAEEQPSPDPAMRRVAVELTRVAGEGLRLYDEAAGTWVRVNANEPTRIVTVDLPR